MPGEEIKHFFYFRGKISFLNFLQYSVLRFWTFLFLWYNSYEES